MRHTISVLVENKFGVLARIAGLFSARGFNIDSLAVGVTEDPEVSRMTIVVNTKDERILEQIKKQLNKLIDVITVIDLTKRDFIGRELVLLKVSLEKIKKSTLLKLLKKLDGKIVKIASRQAIVEVSAEQDDLKELLFKLKDAGLKELTRTGRIAISIN
ncbi:MAG: acetolactate synthase small subunit [Candidatus Gygaella obscura]|nr:acetolactate synthase small subunit [Candidatus Gygaella obscura]